MMRGVRGVAVLVMAGAVAIAAVAWFGGAEGEPGRLRYALSFAAPFLAAGLVALMAERLDRPRHVLAAGVALVPLSLVSVIATPLLAPAFLLALMGWRSRPPNHGPTSYSSVVVLVGIVGGLVALLVHDDPRSWITDSGVHHVASDTVTVAESLVSAAFLVVAVAAAGLVGDDPSGAAEGELGDAVHAGVDGQK